MNQQLRCLRLFSICLLVYAATGSAQTMEWDDGGAGKNWSNTFNWSPNGLPSVGTDVVIGNLPAGQSDATILDQDFSIRGLQLMNAASADTSGNALTIGNGLLDIGLASRLFVSEHATGGVALQTTSMNIANLAELSMNGGRARMGGSVDVNLGGSFTGFGHFTFTNGLTSPTTIFTNNGSLSTGRAAGSAATDHFTLTLAANDPDARMDLDGVNNDRVVSLADNTTLDIDMKSLDFAGTMTLNSDSILNMHETWQSGSGSVFNVFAFEQAFTSATVTNGHWFALSGTDINVNSGTLVIDADFDSEAGSTIDVINGRGIQFNQTATIGGDLNTSGTFELTVNGNLTINDANFDWDGGDTAASFTTIGTGGLLTVNAASIDSDNEYDGTLHINGGTLETSIIGGIFNVGGDINMDSTTGDALIRGSTMDLDGDLVATGGNFARLNNGVMFRPGASSTVNSNTNLRINQLARFLGGSSHTGDGEMSFTADILVEGATTIDMPGGVVRLDVTGSDRTVTVDADFTINAAGLGQPIGSAGFGTHTIDIDNTNATLTVHLTNPSTEWTLGEDGVINISGASSLQTSLAGSAVNVRGRINVNDNTRFTARLDIESPGIVDLNSSTLHLNGGSTSAANTIAGGFIDGNNGLLNSAGNTALTGFGTIQPDINFVAGADLRAENGSLVINGDILGADILGSGPGGTLLLNNPLNTSVVNALELSGGRVLGQQITNTGFIRGHGMLESAGLTNLGSISAEGGELVIDTTNAPDLDSFGTSATLHALTGDLTVVDALSDDFSGTATIGTGRTIEFQAGWTQGLVGELFLMGTSTVAAELQGGQSILRGTTTVDQLAEISAPTTLRSTGEFALPDSTDHLNMTANLTVEAGATFTGNGRLINDGGVMTLEDQATIDIFRLENRGQLRVAGGAIGEVFVHSLEVANTGTVEFHIAGNMPGDYDVLNWGQSSAILDGALEVLLSGYTPSLGDTFSLMTSSLGVTSGTFATTNLPTLSGDLGWQVDYSDPHAVWLRVVQSMISGDFDGNGDYACDDVDSLVSVIATGSNDSNFDLTGDGSVNNADLDAWLAEAGAAELASGNPYLYGDANLDGTVDGLDFIAWNANKFTATAEWCAGDFNADGTVDGLDFIVWNANKFTSADAGVSAVPEPTATLSLLIGLAATCVGRRRQRASK